LDTMRRKNEVRMYKLVSQQDEFAIVYTADLTEHIDNLIQSLSESDLSRARAAVLTRFISELLPSTWEVSVLREQLLAKIHSSDLLPHLSPDDAISYLVNCGLLLGRDRNAYWFAIPGTGSLISDISKGRKELLQVIKRKPHKEMLLKELHTKRLRQSERGLQFHLRDMLGNKILRLVPTTVGELVQINTSVASSFTDSNVKRARR